jgi:hypothetical protein
MNLLQASKANDGAAFMLPPQHRTKKPKRRKQSLGKVATKPTKAKN